MDVAVVGAGAAGLAAAWTLVEAGARVTLYERHASVGGRLRSDDLDGATVDPTVQLLGSYFEETFRLAREVGAGGLLVRSPGVDALWRGGRAHALTYGSTRSMLASGALPPTLKLKLGARYLPFLTRHAAALDANAPMKAAAAGLDHESIAAWGGRELGEAFVEYLAYPLLAAYYGSMPETTSAGFYHALARAGLDVSVYAVKGGTGALAAVIADGVQARGGTVRSETELTSVQPVDGSVELEHASGRERHDAAIIALPPAAASRLVRLPQAAREWLAGVRNVPGLSVALLVEGSIDLPYFGLSFPRDEAPGKSLAALCIEDRKVAGLVPSGRSLLIAYPVPALVPRLLGAEPRAVLDALLPSVEAVVPGVTARVVRARVYRGEDGVGEFYPGYLEHLRCYDQAVLPPNLQLAGSYLVAPTVEGAVRSGRAAARRLLG